MNISQAYKLLELPDDATEKEVKKQFKKLAVKYHPDINKDPDAESKSKEISEAYNFILKYLEDTKNNQFSYGFSSEPGWNPFKNPFKNPFTSSSYKDIFDDIFEIKKSFKDADINLKLNLTFAESVLGKKHDISVTRKVACNSCSGKSKISSHDDCDICGGRGFISSEGKQNKKTQVHFVTNCGNCHATGKKHVKCSNCNDGRIEINSNFSIDIPGGISDGITIRLRNSGNYKGLNNYGDILLKVNVEPDPDMKLEISSSDDGFIQVSKVTSSIKISLLEALEGATKTIRTVLGEKSIEIKPQSKNNDVIVLSGYGVEKQGDHIVTVQVEYPENQLEELIKFLKEKCQ